MKNILRIFKSLHKNEPDKAKQFFDYNPLRTPESYKSKTGYFTTINGRSTFVSELPPQFPPDRIEHA